MTQLTDFLGNPLAVGDRIAMPQRHGSSLNMSVFTIREIHEKLDWRDRTYFEVRAKKEATSGWKNSTDRLSILGNVASLSVKL